MKLKHHVSTAVVVGLCLVAGVFLLWDRGKVSTGEAELRAINLIDAWRPDDLTQIDVAIDDARLSLKREHPKPGEEDREWALYSGNERIDGDIEAMSELAQNLELATFERKLTDAPSDSGLASPRASYTLSMGDLRYVVRVGGPAPTPEGAAYVEVEGGGRGKQIYVVDKETAGELVIDRAKLRNRRLAMHLSVAVERYAIAYPGTSFTLARGGWGGRTAGAFAIDRHGHKIRASHRAVDAFITAVGRIEVARFLPVPERDPEDALHLTITPKTGAPVELIIGGECEAGAVMAVRRAPDPAAGCVVEGVLEQLRAKPEVLLDRRVVGTAETDIVELQIVAEEGTVELARKGGGWHMRKPDEGQAEDEQVKALLDAMLAAEGTLVENPDLDALGLRAPRGRVRITGLPERASSSSTNMRDEHIEISAPRESGESYVLRKDDGAVLRLDAEAAAYFLPRPALLRSTDVIKEEMKYVRRLAVDCDGREQQVERDLSGNWSFVKPDDAEVGVDGALVNDVVDGTRGLKALRWVSEAPTASQGLEPASCKIDLTFIEPDPGDPTGDAKNERHVILSLGAETQGGNYAMTNAGKAVFVAPRALRSAAGLWLMSRTSLLLQDEDIDLLKLENADGKTLTISRQGSKWKVEGGADKVGEQVRRALDQLTAEVVLSRGPAPEGAFDKPALKLTVKRRSKPDAPIELVVGNVDVWQNTRVFLVRRSDIAVTYAVAQARIQPLLDAL